MSEANEAAVRGFYEAFNTGNVDSLDQHMAADAVDHDPYNPNGQDGIEGAKRTIAMYREAFPDLRFEIEDLIVAGDKVVTRWTAVGTHEAEVMGIPASHNVSTVTGIGIDRCEDGKIAEAWTSWDVLGMMQQTGALPDPQAAQA